MKVLYDDRGRIIRLHQSDIDQYLTCPERARALWAGEVEDGPTDATAIGTAVHAAIEEELSGSTDSPLDVAYSEFREEEQHPLFRWVKVAKRDTAHQHIRTAFEGWRRLVYPMLGQPVAIERRFELELDTRYLRDRVLPTRIVLSGVIDYVDEVGLIWDWKTSSDLRKYQSGWGGEGWKLKRWGIQPTVYSYAAHILRFATETPVTFLFAGLSKTDSNVASILPVERGPGDWDWLRQLCWNIVGMLDSGLEQWPTIDSHALCSATWCPVWRAGRCKGATVDRPLTRV